MKHIRVQHLIQVGAAVEYVYGQRPRDGKDTPEDMSSGEVAAFLMAHPEVTSKRVKVQRCLAFLSQFAP
jgi:hypothetical protein